MLVDKDIWYIISMQTGMASLSAGGGADREKIIDHE
jgi:hypothetical protein